MWTSHFGASRVLILIKDNLWACNLTAVSARQNRDRLFINYQKWIYEDIRTRQTTWQLDDNCWKDWRALGSVYMPLILTKANKSSRFQLAREFRATDLYPVFLAGHTGSKHLKSVSYEPDLKCSFFLKKSLYHCLWTLNRQDKKLGSRIYGDFKNLWGFLCFVWTSHVGANLFLILINDNLWACNFQLGKRSLY